MNHTQEIVNLVIAKVIDSMQEGVEQYGEGHTGVVKTFGRVALHNGKIAILKIEITSDEDKIEDYEEWHETPLRELPLIESVYLKEGIQ